MGLNCLDEYILASNSECSENHALYFLMIGYSKSEKKVGDGS